MDYLNAKERNAVASLVLTVGVAEDILKSKNTTKEEAKKLKKIQEWNEKYLAELFKRVPGDRPKILRIYRDCECLLATKSAVRHKYANIPNEVIDDLIEVAVKDKCKACIGENFKACKLFELQQEMNVFMVQDREGFCPYAYDADGIEVDI